MPGLRTSWADAQDLFAQLQAVVADGDDELRETHAERLASADELLRTTLPERDGQPAATSVDDAGLVRLMGADAARALCALQSEAASLHAQLQAATTTGRVTLTVADPVAAAAAPTSSEPSDAPASGSTPSAAADVVAAALSEPF